jgi:hypothetical protein
LAAVEQNDKLVHLPPISFDFSNLFDAVVLAPRDGRSQTILRLTQSNQAEPKPLHWRALFVPAGEYTVSGRLRNRTVTASTQRLINLGVASNGTIRIESDGDAIPIPSLNREFVGFLYQSTGAASGSQSGNAAQTFVCVEFAPDFESADCWTESYLFHPKRGFPVTRQRLTGAVNSARAQPDLQPAVREEIYENASNHVLRPLANEADKLFSPGAMLSGQKLYDQRLRYLQTLKECASRGQDLSAESSFQPYARVLQKIESETDAAIDDFNNRKAQRALVEVWDHLLPLLQTNPERTPNSVTRDLYSRLLPPPASNGRRGTFVRHRMEVSRAAENGFRTLRVLIKADGTEAWESDAAAAQTNGDLTSRVAAIEIAPPMELTLPATDSDVVTARGVTESNPIQPPKVQVTDFQGNPIPQPRRDNAARPEAVETFRMVLVPVR